MAANAGDAIQISHRLRRVLPATRAIIVQIASLRYADAHTHYLATRNPSVHRNQGGSIAKLCNRKTLSPNRCSRPSVGRAALLAMLCQRGVRSLQSNNGATGSNPPWRKERRLADREFAGQAGGEHRLAAIKTVNRVFALTLTASKAWFNIAPSLERRSFTDSDTCSAPFVSHIFSLAGSNTGAGEDGQGRILCAA